jgi:hypothetical protein
MKSQIPSSQIILGVAIYADGRSISIEPENEDRLIGNANSIECAKMTLVLGDGVIPYRLMPVNGSVKAVAASTEAVPDGKTCCKVKMTTPLFFENPGSMYCQAIRLALPAPKEGTVEIWSAYLVIQRGQLYQRFQYLGTRKAYVDIDGNIKLPTEPVLEPLLEKVFSTEETNRLPTFDPAEWPEEQVFLAAA